MTDYPTMKIEAGFGADPMDATPAWTDITQYARKVNYDRGRQHELGRTEPGTGRLALWNPDRRFDPTNTSSPYWPNLVPNTRVRVTATWAGTPYKRFVGFAQSWNPQWPADQKSECIVELADILSILATRTIPEGIWALVLPVTPGLRAWWRLGEPAGSTVSIDELGTYHGAYLAPKTDADSLVFADSNKAAAMNAVNWVELPDTGLTITTDFTVEAIFSHAPASPGGSIFAARPYADTTNFPVILGMDASGHITVTVDNSRANGVNVITSSAVTLTTVPTYHDGNPHHVAVTKSGATVKLFCDGALQQTGSLTLSTGFKGGTAAIGYLWTGTLDEVAWFTSAVTDTGSDTSIAGHAGAMGSTTAGGARIDQIMTYLGIDPAELSIDGSFYFLFDLVGAYAPSGTALQVLQEFAAYLGGLFYAAADGTVTFRGRRYSMAAPGNTSQVVLNDANNIFNFYPYQAPLVVRYDIGDVHNDIGTSRDGGIAYRATDDASVAQYGARDLSGFTGLPLSSDLALIDLANWLVGRYAQPQARIDSVKLLGNTAPNTLYPQILSREIGDRITVTRHPPGGGTWTTDQVIEGVADDLDAETGKWLTTWRLSPADATLYMVLDDTVSGMLNTGVLAY